MINTIDHLRRRLQLKFFEAGAFIGPLKGGVFTGGAEPLHGGDNGRRNTIVFQKIGSTGRTDLKIGQSEAKLRDESFGEVQKCVALQNQS